MDKLGGLHFSRFLSEQTVESLKNEKVRDISNRVLRYVYYAQSLKIGFVLKSTLSS